MKVIVRSVHVDLTDPIKQYVEKRLEKLSKFADHIMEIIVELDNRTLAAQGQRHVAIANVHGPGTTIHAETQSQDLCASIDLLIEKLDHQLSKYKAKKTDHHKKDSPRRPTKPESPSVEFSHTHSHPNLLSESNRHVMIKPVDSEEAIAYLKSHKLPFVVFRNSETEEVNVVHPLSNGEYGLIEP